MSLFVIVVIIISETTLPRISEFNSMVISIPSKHLTFLNGLIIIGITRIALCMRRIFSR